MYNRFQTDALNPSSLPTASLGRPRPLSRFNPPSTDPNLDNLAIGQRQQAVLDRVHEEWNGRIDREVKAVAGSLKDLVNLADVRCNHHPCLSSVYHHLPSSTDPNRPGSTLTRGSVDRIIADSTRLYHPITPS